MYEKKQVLYDLRVAYDGPFKIEDFYAELISWAEKKGFVLESKKKLEHLEKNGKNIEWVIEIHHKINYEYISVVRIRILITNLKDISLERKGKKTSINNGNVLVSIDGFLNTIYSNYWAKKPVYFFIRTIIDQYIYNFWQDKEEGFVSVDCHDVYKTIRAFFHLQKYTYE